MPTNLVKSKQDEADWAEARRIVDKQYPDKSPDDKDKSYWKLTTSIYENIKKNRGKKQMQKQASVGELLAGQIRMRKEAAAAPGWQAQMFRNIRDNIKKRISSSPAARSNNANTPAKPKLSEEEKQRMKLMTMAVGGSAGAVAQPYLLEAYKRQQQQRQQQTQNPVK